MSLSWMATWGRGWRTVRVAWPQGCGLSVACQEYPLPRACGFRWRPSKWTAEQEEEEKRIILRILKQITLTHPSLHFLIY